MITIRTTRELSTKTVETGAPFSAVLEEPIRSGDWTIAAAGAKVDGRVVEADKGGRVKGKASLSIELTGLTLADGTKIELVTSPISNEAAANKGKNAAKVGIAAGTGAAIGAIAGGGKGAAIGAVAGGAVGTLARGESAEIPAESVIGVRASLAGHDPGTEAITCGRSRGVPRGPAQPSRYRMTIAAPSDQKLAITFSLFTPPLTKSPSAAMCWAPNSSKPTRLLRPNAQPAP